LFIMNNHAHSMWQVQPGDKLERCRNFI